jgi:hypothetical protein
MHNRLYSGSTDIMSNDFLEVRPKFITQKGFLLKEILGQPFYDTARLNPDT